MSHYEQTLLAYGVDPATARRDAFINEVRRLVNRERYVDSAEYAAGEGPQPSIPYEARRGD